jgi:Tol biopolymer transport system component
MKKLLLIIATVFFIQVCNAQADSLYLGQTPPGNTPVLFAPGMVSTDGYNEHTLSVSPDGNEIYFTRDPGYNTMLVIRHDTIWDSPISAGFTGREAIFSPDGSKIFYNDGDIWYIEKNGDTWSSPTKLGSNINTTAHEYYASATNDGTLYFSRIDADHAHIYKSKYKNGQYLVAERLPSPINLNSCNNYHPFVSPNGDYIVYNSNRSGGFGGADLYISFQKENGDWSNAINLGDNINSSQYDLCPVFSPDLKYLFFTRYNASTGEGDVYWVSSSIIDSLKNDTNKTSINQSVWENIQAFPNPTTGKYTISFNTVPPQQAFVEIFNLQGNLVFSETFHKTAAASIDLKGFQDVTYIIKVIADGAGFEEKVLKE